MKILVVGGGILGSSIAFRLAEAGADVVLLEAGMPGGGTSGASFAWVSSRSKRPREYFDLNLRGMDAHRRLAAELGESSWWAPCGGLEWVELDDEAAEAELARLGEWGYRCQTLDRAQVAELEPDLELGEQERFLLCPDEGYVFCRPLIGRLAAAARNHRFELQTGRDVVSVETQGGVAQGVRCAGGSFIGADAVVLSPGASANALLRPFGLAPLFDRGQSGYSGTGRAAGTFGLLAVTESVPSAIRRVVHAPGLHFRPDGGGRLILQDTEVEASVGEGTSGWPPPPEANELLERARRLVRHLDRARLEAVRIGVRPLPKDGMPVVGWVPGASGLYLAVTHSGVTLGPLLGELVATEMLEGTAAPVLQGFRPGRFAGARV
ncbi:FAD-binding oxidoreductase [Candidatus Nephthysia bennettiae]|uniref:FAD-binding oxidoreductase n=1 Tax=Candidatus Nephthysia bennettiae TaxID=3127016 RepID=A0A934K983_9BACT|nr:FAD-binding oxidoreductase [Candidatus Dormibacteraeota bacterium]MBJ7612389.1 FAD-binding oxidoreductase [Candidatus Dormibacteraeota bacterium]